MIQRVIFASLCLLVSYTGAGQSPNWRDSLRIRTSLLREHIQEQNYEAAQVEADELRVFLQQRYTPYPPSALTLLSAVYLHNRDKESALSALSEAAKVVESDRDPETKAALLVTLQKEYERWGALAEAAAAQQLLAATQDSIALRKMNTRTRELEDQIDSLSALLQVKQQENPDQITLDRTRWYVLVGSFSTLLLALFGWQALSTKRWRQRWERREREWDLQQGKPEVPLPEASHSVLSSPVLQPVVQTEAVSAYHSPKYEAWLNGDKEMPIALVVENNRQIALYIRSLISTHYQVEMVGSSAEAMKRVHELLPDLIVCDALLQSNEGIDLIRQVKLSDKTSHIPVLLLSRHHGNEGRLDSLRAGADAWFTRPIQSDDFNGTIQELQEKQKHRHEDFNRFIQLCFTNHRPSLTDRFLSEVVLHIEQQMGNPDFMPDEIARKLQMTNPHFVRKLRALTGKEPAQLIRELRLEKAKYLLEQRVGTPQAISGMVGFSNPGIFSMAFKDYFGDNTNLLMVNY